MSKPKGEIKRFNVTLTEEQKLAKARVLQNSVTFLKGAAGSAKTFLACNIALDLLFRKDNPIERVFVSRPFIYQQGEEKLGALPGDVRDKLIGMTTPILDNMYLLAGKEKIEMCIETGEIVILPSVFMKGMTISNSVIILDEYQNSTVQGAYNALSRLGKNSKIIATGDLTQCDLPSGVESGISFFNELEKKNLKGYEVIELQSNHRHDIVDSINSIYKNFRS